jgi:glyoxylase-like metal-dependent hydrolase (beta-lactamase superfamily II)
MPPSHTRSALVAACCAAPILAPALRAQGTPFTDSLLPRIRALAASVPGERPQSLRVMKIVESAGPLRNYVAVDDSTRVPSCFPVFQIRWRDRWIVVDAALDTEAITQFYGAAARSRITFHQDRYDRLELALRDADRIVLTHEHVDHAVGVERGPYFATVAARTLLTDEQLQTFLHPPARVDVPLTPDTAALFPVLHYGLLYPLAPGVVLIKAPGHTAGSQYVYVQLANGKEVLILADLAWQHEGLAMDRQRPEATSRSLAEDRDQLQPQLEWARRIWQSGEVAIVLSHDSRLLDSLVTSGVLASDFDLRRP